MSRAISWSFWAFVRPWRRLRGLRRSARFKSAISTEGLASFRSEQRLPFLEQEEASLAPGRTPVFEASTAAVNPAMIQNPTQPAVS